MKTRINSGAVTISLFIVFLSIINCSFAQKDFSGLEQLLQQNEKYLDKKFSVLIEKADETVLFKKENNYFRTRLQAPIGDASKWLTAALVMVFVDDGSISLDDRVVDYLPVFGNYFKRNVTIRYCLTNLTGIESESGGLKKMFSKKKFNTLEEEVNSLAAKEYHAKPGEEFRDGNIGITIAARVCEVVGKKRFEYLIQQRLLRPMQMRQTTFNSFEGGAPGPADGAKSTAEDYMKFLVMLMHKGMYNGVKILSEESVNELLKIHVQPDLIKYSPPSAKGFTYAMGSWVMEEKDGNPTAFITPELPGIVAIMDLCRGYAAVLFVNDISGDEKPDFIKQVKESIDSQVQGNCN